MVEFTNNIYEDVVDELIQGLNDVPNTRIRTAHDSTYKLLAYVENKIRNYRKKININNDDDFVSNEELVEYFRVIVDKFEEIDRLMGKLPPGVIKAFADDRLNADGKTFQEKVMESPVSLAKKGVQEFSDYIGCIEDGMSFYHPVKQIFQTKTGAYKDQCFDTSSPVKETVVIYIPEGSSSHEDYFTAQKFIDYVKKEAEGRSISDEEIEYVAKALFGSCTWEHPATTLEEEGGIDAFIEICRGYNNSNTNAIEP